MTIKAKYKYDKALEAAQAVIQDRVGFRVGTDVVLDVISTFEKHRLLTVEHRDTLEEVLRWVKDRQQERRIAEIGTETVRRMGECIERFGK